MADELGLLERNLRDFLKGAEREMGEESWNTAVTLYFKALATYGTILVFRKYKVVVKDHKERFEYLEMIDGGLVKRMRKIFSVYRRSYNLRLSEREAKRVGEDVRKIVSGTEEG